jgi:hypothetical protein
MMDFGKLLTLVGAALLVFAWASAANIPNAADNDYTEFAVAASVKGAHTSTANFPDAFKQMSAQRRMLQNFYVGAAALICLAAGVSRWGCRNGDAGRS